MPSCSLDLPEGIATMRPLANRIERANLGKSREVSARKRRHATREFFNGCERALRSCGLNLSGRVLSHATGKAKAETERK